MSETVIVALGTSLGNRLQNLINAKKFLSGLARSPLRSSSVYETEPVGPSENNYFNAVVSFETDIPPEQLITRFKDFEKSQGRDMQAPRWTDRIIDLDIIAYGRRHISSGLLQIPHPEYPKRPFVLLPLEEINSDWTDPVTGLSIKKMIEKIPGMYIKKTDLHW